MKRNLELLKEELHKQPYLLKKISSFDDLNEASIFVVKHFIELVNYKKRKFNTLKIDYNAYSSFQELYKTHLKLFPDIFLLHEFKYLTFNEKIDYLSYHKIKFEILKDEHLVINPKDYLEISLIGSKDWCVTKSLNQWRHYTSNSKHEFFIICNKYNSDTFDGIVNKKDSYFCFNHKNKPVKPSNFFINEYLKLNERKCINDDDALHLTKKDLYFCFGFFYLLFLTPYLGLATFFVLLVAIGLNETRKFFILSTIFISFAYFLSLFSPFNYFPFAHTVYSNEYFSIAHPYKRKPDSTAPLIKTLLNPNLSDDELISNYEYIERYISTEPDHLKMVLPQLHTNQKIKFLCHFIEDDEYYISSIIPLLLENYDIESLKIFINCGFNDFKLFNWNSILPHYFQDEISIEFINILDKKHVFGNTFKFLKFSYLYKNDFMISFFEEKIKDDMDNLSSLEKTELKLLRNLHQEATTL